MIHGMNNDFLYLAYHIKVDFVDGLGNEKSGSGTCFFIRKKDGEMYLVTNRHILDISYKKTNKELDKFELKGICISGKAIDHKNGNKLKNTSFQIRSKDVIFPKNKDNDVIILHEVIVMHKGNEHIIDFFVDEGVMATSEDFEKNLAVCDLVSFPGFPEWHDKKGKRPIMRSGIISSDPRENYHYNHTVTGDCIAYEAFSYNGSSGSPVFALQKGIKVGSGIKGGGYRRLILIGINAGHLKVKRGSELHSGISYFYKSSVIKEMIGK